MGSLLEKERPKHPQGSQDFTKRFGQIVSRLGDVVAGAKKAPKRQITGLHAAELEVHHKRFRSHTGDNSEENLITLCVSCHGEMHSKARDVWV